MRIFWCTVDRSNRVAPHIFKTLLDGVSRIAEVEVESKKFNMLTGELCKAIYKEDYYTGKTLDPIYINQHFDFVFTDAIFAFNNEEWKNIKIPKVLLLEDLHGELVQYYSTVAIDEFKFDCIFTRYKNPSKKLLPEIYKTKVKWLPHCINENATDYGLNKDHGILLTGSLNSNVYPIRSFIFDRLNGESFFTHIQRPEETVENVNEWPSGNDYFKLLNSSKISVGTTSIYNYPVIKLFEIPACNSVLLSDYNDEMKELGFIPNENMVEIDVKNLCNQVKSILEDDEFREKVSKNGYQMVHENHNGRTRAKQFLNKIKKI